MIVIDFTQIQPDILKSSDLEIRLCWQKKTQNSNEFFYTSGTSGDKKKFEFSQLQIKKSVNQTIQYFGLKKGDTIVNPLPLEFVAGKMNIYRAIYGDLNYIQIPPKNITENLPKTTIDFITLVPNQLHQILESKTIKPLIKQILVGGGEWTDIDNLKKLKKTKVFQSFASTETLTHFAIKQIYPLQEEYYTVLPGFTVDEKDGVLFVNHPIICEKGVFMDDLIELKGDCQFKWVGRKTNMIKSGGIKLFPELIERKISNFFNQKFVILGMPDDKFGEIVVLCIEGKKDEDILFKISGVLDRYELPKKIIEIECFPLTEAGKVKRKELAEKLKNQL
jgi:O-succinylbenzoic acid--CoA ligase